MVFALDRSDAQPDMGKFFVHVVDANAHALRRTRIDGAIINDIGQVIGIQSFTFMRLDAMERVENGKLHEAELHGFCMPDHNARSAVDPAEPAVGVSDWLA